MTTRSDRSRVYRGALQPARQEILAMRANDEIGGDAFHQIEEEWIGSTSESRANGRRKCNHRAQ
jgi:hypothetical protein